MSDDRRRAVELVRVLMSGGGATEDETDALLAELKGLVPDPNVSDLIFWPQTHPLSRDLRQDELTAELVVELAFKYPPFAL